LNLKTREIASVAPVAGSVALIRLTSLNLPGEAFKALRSAPFGLKNGPPGTFAWIEPETSPLM
jgi:hypothetical protein